MKGNGYCKAVVYGYGPIGKLLYEELKKAGCDIPYIVDKNPALQAENIHIYHDMENLKKSRCHYRNRNVPLRGHRKRDKGSYRYKCCITGKNYNEL